MVPRAVPKGTGHLSAALVRQPLLLCVCCVYTLSHILLGNPHDALVPWRTMFSDGETDDLWVEGACPLLGVIQ